MSAEPKADYSVIIPAYNEEQTIRQVVAEFRQEPHLDEILLGMPAELMQFGGGRMTTYRPGLWWAEDHSALYAEWSDTAAPIEKVDPKLWKPLWLSDFRRLVEDGAVVTVRS